MPGFKSDGVQRTPSAVGAPLCCGCGPPPLLSPCMQLSRHMMPGLVNATTPRQPPAISIDKSFYLLEKHSNGKNQSHQQPRSTEKTNVAVLNQPKMRKENKPAAAKREKEWAKPESSGALPKLLEACDRSLFYPSTREIGSLCLIHS